MDVCSFLHTWHSNTIYLKLMSSLYQLPKYDHTYISQLALPGNSVSYYYRIIGTLIMNDSCWGAAGVPFLLMMMRIQGSARIAS